MKKKNEELQAQILDTAIALFIEKGIPDVTTRELTEQLGLSRSHIYHYFSNWQALCLCAIDRFMAREITQFTEEIAGLKPDEKLLKLAEIYLPDDTDATWKLYDSLWQMAANHREYAQLAETNIESWKALIGGIVQQGVDEAVFRPINVTQVVRQLSAMLNGYAEVLSISPAPEKHQQALADIKDFMQMALAQPA